MAYKKSLKLISILFAGFLSMSITGCLGEDPVKPVDPSDQGGDDNPGDNSKINEFPKAELKSFLDSEGLTTEVPSPVSKNEWTSGTDEDDYGAYFYALTIDEGTIGTDSIEDTYKALLEKTSGWTVDDSNYDDYGYIADKGDVEIEFYTYDGYFEFYVWAAESGDSTDQGGDDNPITNTITCADAIKIIKSLADNVTTTETYKISGIIADSYSVKESNQVAGTYQFNMADDNSDSEQLVVWWGSCDTTPVQGDKIIVEGNLQKYVKNNSTKYEVMNSKITIVNDDSGDSGDSGDNQDITPKEKVEWTIMLYMCGSTLESDELSDGSLCGLATDDIEEILKVKNQPESVNIIIETGGASSWASSYGNASKLLRWHVSNNTLVKDATLNKASMGDAATLQSFLEWGMEYYPAEKFGLFLWNHGGAMDGCCFDENYDDDSLTNEEVNKALTDAKATLKRTENLEFIAYDACLMAIQDVVEFNSHHFNYMLASQESEGGYGYDYDAWLPLLYKNPTTVTTKSLLTEIGSTFLAEEETLFEQWKEPFDQTQSVFDLSKVATYKNAFEEIATGLSSTVNSSNWSAFVKNNLSANNVQKYGIDEDGYYLYDIFDAEDVLDNIAKNYSDLSSKVAATKVALNELVIWEDHGDATSGCGMNIFCPIEKDYNRYYKADTNFTNWYNLCKLSGLCID